MKQFILAAVLIAFTATGFAGEGPKEGKKSDACKMACCKKEGAKEAKDAKCCKDGKDCKDKTAKAEKKA